MLDSKITGTKQRRHFLGLFEKNLFKRVSKFNLYEASNFLLKWNHMLLSMMTKIMWLNMKGFVIKSLRSCVKWSLYFFSLALSATHSSRRVTFLLLQLLCYTTLNTCNIWKSCRKAKGLKHETSESYNKKLFTVVRLLKELCNLRYDQLYFKSSTCSTTTQTICNYTLIITTCKICTRYWITSANYDLGNKIQTNRNSKINAFCNICKLK